MRWPFRITAPLLDVVQALRDADGPTHGWYLAEVTGQSGPNVYRALRRLQDAAWVDYAWVDSPESGRPRRRLYWLTPAGNRASVDLLAQRTGDSTSPGETGTMPQRRSWK